jgi:hypothetical protein
MMKWDGAGLALPTPPMVPIRQVDHARRPVLPNRPQGGRRRDNNTFELNPRRYQCPVFGIEIHGSCGGSGAPFCSSSIE